MGNFQLNYTGSQINAWGGRLDALEETVGDLFDLIYPIGAIYISVDSTDPSILFGGTWEQIEGQFLLASSSTYAAGSTGGEATHIHTTGGHTLTASEMPKHGHLIYVWDNTGTTANAWYYNASGEKTTHSGARLYNSSASTWVASGSTASAAGSGRGDPSGGAALSGGGGSHSHGNTGSASTLPPYLSVYMWKRTA